MTKKAYIFLADGFEEVEGLTVADILRRGGIETVLVSIGASKAVQGSHGIRLEADSVFAAQDYDDAQLLVLPGGMPGTKYLLAHEGLAAELKKAKDRGVWIGAICAAPTVLGAHGLLEGEEAVCYPGMESGLTGAKVPAADVAVSHNIVTSRGVGTAIAFALRLLALLTDEETAQRIADSIVYSC